MSDSHFSDTSADQKGEIIEYWMSLEYKAKFNLEALLKEIDEQYPQCFKYNLRRNNWVKINILDNPNDEEIQNVKKALKEVELAEVC